MRSFIFTSVFALALSVSALQSPAKRNHNLDTIGSIAGYPIDVLEKRHYNSQPSRLVETGYKCESTSYDLKRVERAKRKACKKIGGLKVLKRKYPKIYAPKDSSAEFRGIKGNQYMFPILKKHVYSRGRKSGHHRVIVSKSSKGCKLVGLVVQRRPFGKSLWRTEFTKCTKVYEKVSH